jgi:hypothetical protein
MFISLPEWCQALRLPTVFFHCVCVNSTITLILCTVPISINTANPCCLVVVICVEFPCKYVCAPLKFWSVRQQNPYFPPPRNTEAAEDFQF